MNKPIEQFKNNRIVEVDNLIIAVIVATGVNLFVSGIAMIGGGEHYRVYIALGTITIFGSIILYIGRHFAEQKRSITTTGFFLYDVDKREMLNIPNYYIATEMWLEMMLANDEIKKSWKNNVLGNVLIVNGRLELERTDSHEIVFELLEFCVLEYLSIVLSSHYSSKREKSLRRLTRDDLPEMLQNRFLDWLSEEPEGVNNLKNIIEKNDCTLEEALEKDLQIHLKGSKNWNKPYHRFEIVLPKNTNIKRENGNIVVENSLLTVTIRCHFSGSNATIPVGFERQYLNTDAGNVKAFDFSVSVDIRFKIKSILFSKKGDRFLWVDQFLDGLYKMVSAEYFFDRIGWYTAETIMRCSGIEFKP